MRIGFMRLTRLLLNFGAFSFSREREYAENSANVKSACEKGYSDFSAGGRGDSEGGWGYILTLIVIFRDDCYNITER